MPIKDVSEERRIPRLGKIKLGIKVKGQGQSTYPKATDYFVVPESIMEHVGEKPTKLNIVFPSDDREEIVPQYLRCYGLSHGLVCWGTGAKARRLMDKKTGEIAGRDTLDWEWHDIDCNTQECEEYGTRCRKVMNLMFSMPDVPGLGVWQLDTSSFYSIREINSSLDLIQKATNGRIAFIPLILSLSPMDVHPPGQKRKSVHTLHLESQLKFSELINASILPAIEGTEMKELSMPEVDVDDGPEDLYPTEILEAAEEQEDPDIFSRKLGEWNQIKKLVKRRNYSLDTIKSYFAQVHKIDLPTSVLRKEDTISELTDLPPKTISLDLLVEFREYLTGNLIK